MDERICMVSVDVENDLDLASHLGVERLHKLTDLFEEYGIRSTLFTVGNIIEKYPDLFQGFRRKHEIASHGYTHTPLPELNKAARRTELDKVLQLHQDILRECPRGFRAVQHNIDDLQIRLLEEYGFEYDSSVMPAYPPFKKYVGWKGPAPLEPYHHADIKLLEVPVSGLLLGVPLSGTWIRKLGVGTFKALLLAHIPQFISLHMHSWDCAELEGIKGSGDKFISDMDDLLETISSSYQFVPGERISGNRGGLPNQP